MLKIIEKYFELSQNNTSIRTELFAGLTTFLTMAYIIFLQPAILSKDFTGNPTGLDFGAILLATCLISAATTILMGIYARYPIALAPGMGENFIFVAVISTLTGMGFENAWRTALGIVFISGVVFLILSLLRVREAIINAISPSLRNGIAVGIGLFIAFIGLNKGGIVVANSATCVSLNNLRSPDVIVFALGLLVAGGLQARRVHGAVLWGIFTSALTAACIGKIKYSGIVGLPEIQTSAFMKMDVARAFNMDCIPFILLFIFMDMFDTVGTLVGVAEQAGFMKQGKLPRASRVLIVDAAGTVAGACASTSTITSYIESCTGIAYGGRTGLTSITVGIFFLAALFFSPLIGMIGSYPPITAPALVIVGAMMMRNVEKIDWNDFSESIPAFLIALGIPLTFSIADGLAMGFISYPLIKLLSGKGKEISWIMYLVGFILLMYLLFVRFSLNA